MGHLATSPAGRTVQPDAKPTSRRHHDGQQHQRHRSQRYRRRQLRQPPAPLLLPMLLPSRWTRRVPCGQLWNVRPAHGPQWTVLNDLPKPTIRGSAPIQEMRLGAERPRQHGEWLTDLLTRPSGTGETTRDIGDAHRGLSPGQRDGAERRRRWETRVVWLITQRSRVQIPPPLPGKTAPGASFPGPFSATCDQTPGHTHVRSLGASPRVTAGVARLFQFVLRQSDGL